MGRESLLQEILTWAEARPDIRVVVLTGSAARDDESADSGSDLDVELFTTTPEAYESTTWMNAIRPVSVQLAFPPESADDYVVRLTIFEGGDKVDFRVAPVRRMEQMVATGTLDEVYERGYRVVFDEDGVTAGLRPPEPPVPAVPTEQEYLAVIEEFWFEAWHIPKYAARGDLWVVKYRDWTMKELLRRMLEWDTAARRPDVDVWYIGTRMKDWVTPSRWERLHEVFAHFDADDSIRAFHATCELFSEVAREVGARLGFTYPAAVERAVLGR